MEKETLGIYISGHPLDAYQGMLQKNATRNSLDFAQTEEGEEARLTDGATEIIGGMITSITKKTTRSNSVMAFVTVEDLLGSVEVIVFPRDYEKYRREIYEDNKIFIRGRVAMEEEKATRLICSEIIPFSALPRELWIKFSDKESFLREEEKLYSLLSTEDGQDETIVYCEAEKAMKRLPRNMTTAITEALLNKLIANFGEKSVKVVEKSLKIGNKQGTI